jgi:EAL domain-containing protein (putative c-di-GMP-specific phosphodiesterase class I)
MTEEAERKARLDDAIIVDEVGIESGGYGIYRLRCLYQPIFERRGRMLRTVAVEGRVAPYVAGEEAPEAVFLAAVAEDDLDFIEHICLALPVRNHQNIGLDAVELVVGAADRNDPEALVERIRFIGGEVAETGLDPALVVCAVRERAASDEALLGRLATEIRDRGMRIAIDDFGIGRWTDGQIEALRPGIVRMDGDWFRKVCRDAVTVRLFDSVVARLHERGLKILVSGIETEQQFGIALRAGADFFQGSHLAPAALVGSIVEEALPLRARLGNSEKIVPLYG